MQNRQTDYRMWIEKTPKTRAWYKVTPDCGIKGYCPLLTGGVHGFVFGFLVFGVGFFFFYILKKM